MTELLDMSSHFWNGAIIVIFFFYGLAFYSMGLALLIESGRSSELSLARASRLLAGFGLLHGAHEWLDMWEKGLEVCSDRCFPMWLLWLRVAILAGSFLALLAFGESLLAMEQQRPAHHWYLTILAAGWYSISAVLVQFIYLMSETEWVTAADALARYVLGIPGAVLACMALWRQRAIFRQRKMDRFVKDLTLASVSFALYGGFGQVFAGKSVIFPANVINSEGFLHITGLPIQLFRAAMAALVAIAMIRVLRALEVENQQRLESIKEAKLEAEQRSRHELSLLNAQLQAANEETARLLHEVQQRDALRGELLQRITGAQEAERQRIARELHDETGQALTGIAMGLHGMAARLSDDNSTKKLLQNLEAIATASLGGLRQMINDLRPPQLDDMGLVAALRWMLNTFAERSGVPAEFEVRGDPLKLPPEIEITLFRIVQESLTNTAKHAQAQHLWVTLDYQDGLSLTVKDDGLGFDPTAALNPNGLRKSWGLIGIQERAALINATFSLESAPGAGTTLSIRVKDVNYGKTSDADQSPDH